MTSLDLKEFITLEIALPVFISRSSDVSHDLAMLPIGRIRNLDLKLMVLTHDSFEFKLLDLVLRRREGLTDES